MDHRNKSSLISLLTHLAKGLNGPEQWRDWHIHPVLGGANNLLFRAKGEAGDFAVKFTLRDDRDRAGHEYQALQALQDAGGQLAPRSVFMDRDSYRQPVVVQHWLPGKMLTAPPQTDEEWSVFLRYLTMIHQISPEHTEVKLQPCHGNANGSEGYAREMAVLARTAQEKQLQPEIVELIQQLSLLPLDCWPQTTPRLCRADHNTRNFIRHEGCLKSVDWEYGGWGDPAEDFAEMMAHVTYIAVPEARWPAVVEEYAASSQVKDLRARIQLCLAIKLVGWAVRIAGSMVAMQTDRVRLGALKGEWRVDTKAKYQYYLERARRHFLHFDL
jgi:aminoglycoside phosphotransferase (APT) family kinase protein